jgi:hypothetical protein
MTYGTAIGAYGIEISNIENALSTALGMALRMFEVVPNLRPDEIKESDIQGDYNFQVKIDLEDSVDKARTIAEGRAMVTAGMRSLRTFLIQDCKMRTG